MSMKRTIMTAALLALIVSLVAGCKKTGVSIPVKVYSTSFGYSEEKSPEKADLEAVKQAMLVWKVTAAGKSYYMSDARTYILEFQNPSFSVARNRITEADQLNGLEWQGSVSFDGDTSRRYAFLEPNNAANGKWGAWRNGNDCTIILKLTKKKGESWKVADAFDDAVEQYAQLCVSDIPK